MDIDPRDLIAAVEARMAMERPTPQEKPKRSPAEVREVKKKMVWLAEAWSRQSRLKVLPGDWWKCGFREDSKTVAMVTAFISGERATLDDLPNELFQAEQILYPEEALYVESEDEICGKIDHECGHFLHTDFKNWFEVQKKARDEGYLATSAVSILNPVEDCRINNLQIGISDHRLRRFQAVYNGWLVAEKQSIASQPVTSAVGTLLIARWIQERLGIIDATEFQEIYANAKPQAQTYFDRLVEPSREYWNTTRAPEARKIYEEKIWPVYRELEEKSIEEEAKQLLMNRKTEPTGGNEDQSPIAGTQSDVREDMLESIMRDMPPEEKEALRREARKELDRKQAENLTKARLPGGTSMEKDPATGEYLPCIKPLDEGEIARGEEKIQTILDEQKESEAKKRKLLQQIQDAQDVGTIQTLLAKEDTFPFDHVNEIKKAAEAKGELLRRQRSVKIQKMKQYGFMSQDRPEPTKEQESLFDQCERIEREVRPRVQRFVDSIIHEIPKKEEVRVSERRVRSGTEVDTDVLGDFAARSQGLIFKALETAEIGDPRIFVMFVVDCSPSMRGKKMEESLKTAIFFTLCLQEISKRTGRPVESAMIFFNENVYDAKGFGDDYDSPVRKRWPDGKEMTVKHRIMDKAQPSGWGTDLGLAVVRANQSLNARKREHPDYMSCLFAVSDGETFGALQGQKLTQFLQGLEEYQGEKMGRHLTLGFYLRDDVGDSDKEKAQETPMEQYFGKRGEGTVVVDDFQTLVPEAEKALKGVLQRMARRLFS